MTPEQYDAFTDTIVRNLVADKHVLGLVSAGSMAKMDHQPDEWSDHDFWIVTEPGAQETFRSRTDWLPDPDQIVLTFRETAHGLKIVYSYGHLVEYAVFDVDELSMIRINSYRILIDRANIETRLIDIQARTVQEAATNDRDDMYLFGQFITNLMVGVGRYARGEKLSAHSFVKQHALHHLLPLLKKHINTPKAHALDNLDSMRRFESAYPKIGAELNNILLLNIPEAAQRLLALAEQHLRQHLNAYPSEAVEVIREYIKSVY